MDHSQKHWWVLDLSSTRDHVTDEVIPTVEITGGQIPVSEVPRLIEELQYMIKSLTTLS